MSYVLICNEGASNAHRYVSVGMPWMSIDASGDELVVAAHLPYPTISEVEKCMNCPYAECRDCIRKRKDSFKPPHRPPVYDITVIQNLVRAGRTSKEISKEVGCAERTARRYIRKFVTSA